MGTVSSTTASNTPHPHPLLKQNYSLSPEKIFNHSFHFNRFSPGMHALPPEKVAELQAKIEAEKAALKEKKDMAEEQRNKAARELEKREKDLLTSQ